MVVAHAGASGHAPANTFGAYRRAHDTYRGVWMEFDAQFSSDDVPMAIHDETLDRTTDASGLVSDRTADELQKVNAAAKHPGWDFEPIPRVRDLVEEGRDARWRLICEVKNIPGQPRFDHSGESYAETLNKIFVDSKFPLDRLVVICFWAPTLDALKKLNGEIALGYLSVPDLPGGMGLTAAQNLDFCRDHGFHVSAPRHSTPDLTSEHVAAAHAYGIQVHVWTTNEPDEIEAAIAKDLDGITSDYPDRVLSALGR